MTEIYKEILDFFQCLELEDDWDCMGAAKLQESVFDHAISMIFQIIENAPLSLVCPEINLCPDGSVDFSFRYQSGDIRLLININQDGYSYCGMIKSEKTIIENKHTNHIVTPYLTLWIRTHLCGRP